MGRVRELLRFGKGRIEYRVSFIIEDVNEITAGMHSAHFGDGGYITAFHQVPAKKLYNLSVSIRHSYNGMSAMFTRYLQGYGSIKWIRSGNYFGDHVVVGFSKMLFRNLPIYRFHHPVKCYRDLSMTIVWFFVSCFFVFVLSLHDVRFGRI